MGKYLDPQLCRAAWHAGVDGRLGGGEEAGLELRAQGLTWRLPRSSLLCLLWGTEFFYN